jgi:hypothetical protein
MEHKIFKEMIQLALLNELNDDEMKELHKHLIECNECQLEYENLTKFYAVINESKTDKIDEYFLHDAREQFRQKLNYELSRQSIVEKLFNSVRKYLWIYKRPVLAGAFSLAIGLFLGYVIFSPDSSHINLFGENTAAGGGGMAITNVRFLNNGNLNGEVEFSFDAVKQVEMKGNIDDPSIQKILAEALVNERNPGTRIRTVNALANQTNVSPSPKVKQALITALEFDGNPAVRREALKALLEFPYDNEINDCLLYVLQRDKNSAMRIAAINGLASAKLNGQIINEETLKVLNQKVKNDDNEYVRIRAASLLKEDKLQ